MSDTVTGEPLLFEARGLELGYGDRPILTRVDLDVRSGDAWFLLGTNGSGKTTLLRALLGLLEPRSGSLRRDPRQAAPERLGFVPQVTSINRSLRTTVREFVGLGLAGLRIPRREESERLTWALARVGLGELRRNAGGLVEVG